MTGEINQLDVIPASGVTQINGGPEQKITGILANTVVYRKRPATKRNPIEKDGWRKPSAFHHHSLLFRGIAPPRRTLRYGKRCQHTTEPRGTRTGLGSGSSNFAAAASPRVSLTENEALIKALNRLRDQEINVSVAMGEARKSYQMVNHRLRSIGLSVLQFRRRFPKVWEQVRRCQVGRRRSSRNSTWCRKQKRSSRASREGIPSGWLELQYGWLPLMADIIGAINEFAREPAPPRIYAKGHGSREWLESWGVVAAVGGSSLSGVPGGNSGKFPVRFHQRAFCSLVYELDDADKRSAGQLGLVSPDEVVWELLPYSFVVDWALPIGPWLSALHADRGLKFKGGSLATVMEAVEMGPAGPFRTYGCGEVDSSYGVRLDIKSFDRKVYTSPPSPGLYVKNPLSVMHGLNGLALLAQAFR